MSNLKEYLEGKYTQSGNIEEKAAKKKSKKKDD